MAAYRINAFEIHMADTLRAMRAGCLCRSSFDFSPRMPHCNTLGMDQASKQATGALGGADGESDSSMPPVKGGGGSDE